MVYRCNIQIPKKDIFLVLRVKKTRQSDARGGGGNFFDL